jgi:hypothetical protein
MPDNFFSNIKNLLTARFLFLLIVFVCCFFISNAQTDTSKVKFSQDTLSNLSVDTLKKDSISVAGKNDFKSKVEYQSEDSIIFDVQDNVVFFYQKAEVKYEDMDLKANYMEVNLNNKIMYSTFTTDSTGEKQGIPDFAQKDDKFTADEMRYNFNTKKGKINGVYTQHGEGYIHGETVKKFGDYEYISHGLYTTCDLPHPHYGIMANKLKVINNKKIITGPAYMKIEDVPVPLAIPFGFFPNTKGQSSGIIFPTYGESGELGFYLKNGGYYFGFSDYVDLALTGDIYSNGSWGSQVYSNYANRYHYNGNLSFTYSKIKTSEIELPDYNVQNQFFINWRHTQDPKARPSSVFSANVNAGSTQNYKTQVSTPENYTTATFASNINYSKTWEGTPFSLSASMKHDQNSLTRIVTFDFPQATFNVSRINPFERKQAIGEQKWYEKIGMSYTMGLQNHVSSPDSLLFDKSIIKKFQNGIIHQIPVTTSMKLFKYFTLSPSFNYTERWYAQTIEKRYDAEHDSVIVDTISGFKAARNYAASASLQTRIYGLVQFRNSKIMAIRHVMSPSVSLTLSPDFSAPSYNYYKTVQTDSFGTISKYSIFETGIFGGPGAGKQGVLNFNLDNNLEMKVRKTTDTSETTKKIKLLESLSFNSSYNIAADSLRWSFININARTVLLDKVTLSGSSSFDPYIIDSLGRRRNISEWQENKRPARFTNASLSVDYSLTQASKKTTTKGSDADQKYIEANPDEYIDLDVPFTLNVSYSLIYSKPGYIESKTSQIINFHGDVSLTPKWKIIFSSGYDFQLHDLSYTSLSFYRDLHCWEMRLNWVPLGAFPYYNFQINIKSAILQDLKYIKKNDVYDN